MTETRSFWRSRRILVVVAIVFFAWVGVTSSASAAPYAYVTNLSSGTVSVIDVETKLLVATIDVGYRPSMVAITPDGTRAYVVHDESDAVNVIDTDPHSPTFNTVLVTIPWVAASAGIAITPDGTRAYITAKFSGAVRVLDLVPASPTYNQVVGTLWGLDYAPEDIAISPDGARAYIVHSTYSSIDLVSVVDVNPASPTYFTRIGTIHVGHLPTGVAVSPDGKRTYVANANPYPDTTVSVVDTEIGSPAYNTVVSSIPFGAWSSPYEVAVSPDGSKLYVAMMYWHAVAVFDTSTFTSIATVPVGTYPVGLTFAPDGSTLWVANSFSANVSIIDTATNSVLATLPVGGYPTAVAITPNTVIQVSIDIKPGSGPNSINLKSKGTVPVAILSSTKFDARTVDPATIAMAGAGVKMKTKGVYMAAFEDVNGDGLPDLVVHFDTTSLHLAPTDTTATLTGATFDGKKIQGQDSVNVLR